MRPSRIALIVMAASLVVMLGPRFPIAATVTAADDEVKPTISNISPVDGMTTNIANPTVSFDVTDTGSGISNTSFASDITIQINGIAVSAGQTSFQQIPNGFRAIFAQGTSFLSSTSTNGFAVTDGVEFSLVFTATDVAGNTATVSISYTIDQTTPVFTPVVVAEPDITIDENSTLAQVLANFTDASGGADIHTATIDWGDGLSDVGTVVESGGSGTVSGSHVYQDDEGGPFVVMISVTDNWGFSHSDTLTANVANVDPVADAGANQSVAVGATFVLTPTTFTDVGVLDTHSALIVWGDGHTDTGAVDQGNDTVSGSHDYAGDGTFPLTVVVIDDDGGFAVDTIEVKVGSGIPKLPTAILSATQWALLLLTLAFGILLIRKRGAPDSRVDV